MQGTHVLDKQASLFPLLESTIKEMRALHNGKLWYQLSMVLLKYIEEPSLQTGTHLIELYDGFVKEIEGYIDEIVCVQLASKASDQYQGLENKLNFLKKINDTLLSDKAAKLLLRTKMASHKLSHGNVDDAWTDIAEINKEIDNMSDLDSIVYSDYYYLASAYYKTKANYEEFYKNSLQYLAYTHESKISAEQKRQISVDMGIACLVSDRIYNFSELLEQPVLRTLKEIPEHSWIYTLLETFNAGDISRFNDNMTKYKDLITGNMILNDHISTLKVKIKIMALLELIFNRPKNDRNVNFDTIAKVTGLKLAEVEPLVIKAMSKQLLKGTIDQVDQKVKVTWIMPRVLDTERIAVMKKKLDSWNKTLESLVKTVDNGNFAAASFV
eukprot:CAMPEP_0176423540 /NCGR_PEP_ID=MMETSP0127-20121128/10339_1 /TAXON_ID=938130 /ORGANISM="Platyophrya macrostoma, Strain WH" /LENGTH=383 /DNA_ID=CAMNT_0017804499 /DNA_START=30 /DNA_END=1181 /DNA_ORIENTATION=+